MGGAFGRGDHVTLAGHTDVVSAVCALPDGRRVVSGSWDGTLRVWDAGDDRDGRASTLEGHEGGVEAVCALHCGRRVVSASRDKTLKVWDVDSGACLATLEGHLNDVLTVCALPMRHGQGARVVSGSKDTTVKVWDVETRRCLATVEAHSHFVIVVSALPDGKRFVSGCAHADGGLKVWALEDQPRDGRCVATLVRTLDGPLLGVHTVCALEGGNWIVAGSADRTVRVWDVDAGVCLYSLDGHESLVSVVCALPCGTRIVSGSWNGEVKVWDVKSGKCLASWKGHMGCIRAACALPDCKRVVTAATDKLAKVWKHNELSVRPALQYLWLVRSVEECITSKHRVVRRIPNHVAALVAQLSG